LKKIISFLLIAAFCLSFTATAFAASPNFRFNGNEVELLNELENRNGHTMIALTDLVELLGAAQNDHERNFAITKNDNTISLTVGSTNAVINGQLATLPVAPYISGANVMVPLTIVSEALGASVFWDNATRTIDVRTSEFDINSLADIDFIFLDRESLVNRGSTVMNFESVRSTALSANRQIEDLALSLRDLSDMIDDFETDHRELNDTLWDTRNRLHQTVGAIDQMSGAGLSIGDLFEVRDTLETGVERAVRGLAEMVAGEVSARNALRSRAETERMIADASEFMVLTYLTNINNNAMDIQLLELVVSQSERNRDFIRLRRDLGMASDEELRAAENTLRQDRASLTALNNALRAERESFNRMLNFPISRDLVVPFSPEIVPVYVSNMDSHAREIIENDVNVRNRRVEAEVARVRLDSLRRHGGEVTTADERAIRSTIDAYDRAVDDLDASIRSTYNTLRQLEEQHYLLMGDLATANNNYRISVANFEIGNITQHELDMARMAVLSVEITVVKNTFQHNNLRFLFERPYLLG